MGFVITKCVMIRRKRVYNENLNAQSKGSRTIREKEAINIRES